jgi:hypothetical protein
MGREHGPGCIIVPVADHLRYAQFFTSYAGMRIPRGSVLAMPRSSAITVSFNQALYQIPDEAEWVFFLGDDHVMGPDTLFNLLDMEVDVAVPLVCKRSFPFNLVVFKGRAEDDWIDQRTKRAYPNWEFFDPWDIPRDGKPFKVVAAGSAGMLVRRNVIEAMEPPYFESTDGAATNEDLGFCMKVREAGFDIWCNPRVQLGHILETVIWPAWNDDNVLQVVMDCGNGKMVVFTDELENYEEVKVNGNGNVVSDSEQDLGRVR